MKIFKSLPFRLLVGIVIGVILGIVISVLGFDDAGTAMVLAIFALQDSFGTACNVTGDGALTLMLTGYANKHNIKENEQANIY